MHAGVPRSLGVRERPGGRLRQEPAGARRQGLLYVEVRLVRVVANFVSAGGIACVAEAGVRGGAHGEGVRVVCPLGAVEVRGHEGRDEGPHCAAAPEQVFPHLLLLITDTRNGGGGSGEAGRVSDAMYAFPHALTF